jgi:hypothetical protein
MRRPLRTLVVLAVLAALLVGADRLAAHIAADRIATAVQTDAHLPHKPKVDVHGFPFLTQAARGRYDRIQVTATDVFGSVTGIAHGAAEDGSVTTVDFDGVHIPPSAALAANVHDIPVDHVKGAVAVSFADVEAASHVPGLRVHPVAGHPDQASIDESVSVAGLAVQAGVVAAVSVSGNTITLKAVDVQLPANVTLPAAVSDEIRAHAGFSVKVPGLPSGVRLTGVAVGGSGVTATVQADNIVLTR